MLLSTNAPAESGHPNGSARLAINVSLPCHTLTTGNLSLQSFGCVSERDVGCFLEHVFGTACSDFGSESGKKGEGVIKSPRHESPSTAMVITQARP
ncbi:MAG: hypothetical protein NTW75_13520 [Planctomycetales bacterium]|nr:hypothetical protein [Planctomycetales bacterium]